MAVGCQELTRSLEGTITKMNEIWDRIGIGKAGKEERTIAVIKHVQNLLEDMVEEEESLEKLIETRINDLTQELNQLTKELHLPDFKPSAGVPILKKEKELRVKADALGKEKKERMKVLTSLKQEDQLLCDRMCMTPYYIPSGTVPTGDQLQELKQHVDKLSKEQEKRYALFIKEKKEIADLMIELDHSPSTGFEKELMAEDEVRFTLSADNMASLQAFLSMLLKNRQDLESTVQKLWERLQTLWTRLEVQKHEQEMFEEGKDGFKPEVLRALREEIGRCEAQKLANIQKFVDAMRQELEQWWNKCYYSAKQRSEFKHFTDTNYTEDLLALHEMEVTTLKVYYENHKHILQLVEKRECLFHKMIEFEKKANDPNRFFSDRGGRLLMEEKERKALMKQLPKVELSVTDEILVWEKDFGRTFLVNGLSFIRYIEKTWKDFEEAKQREKEERQKAKTKLMNEEMIFGSKPSTPVKRRFQPTNTPVKNSKQRKIDTDSTASSASSYGVRIQINDTCKTPSSTSKMQHTTVYHSPYRKTQTASRPHTSRMIASTSKLGAPGSRNRRRSSRLARKILGEKNDGTNETSVFSHTTLTSNCNSNGLGGNISLASTGSYKDFALQIPDSLHSTKLKTPSPARRAPQHF